MPERNYLPLFIDMSSKKVLIFGGGKVGERKALLFKDFAPVTVISASFTENLNKCSDEIDLIESDISDLTISQIEDFVKDSFIVITATNNPELNEKIGEIAERSGALVNSVNLAGDLIIPSVIRQDPVLLGISTMGNSPALSKFIRLELEKVITPAYGQMAKLQDECRDILKERISEESGRKTILWEILENREIWDAFAVSYEKAYNIAYNIMLEHFEDN
ncbi:precorrin-2 dehydrogenase/sirohydrochlorin ferrochelatase [Methanohalophilus levihalophilus]|uniref:precorrin-2 dehydrogenase/sirohydrochlorin ferrochelatase family protein n=1 Tax=Methanohalophilus levihalophilus TaxID=1431282 RepID=UPI001AE5C9FD|nr:bifunctional precorrin-2 dehydrogenase/sirohydrochlorin ferrochelatase [Methanohalophilus levihalophilus]MBP2031052.1 precorrin-2 dehydrogenase/sirohydrochlorin ferrochelatase [Methanohalophilus levihalophilus]